MPTGRSISGTAACLCGTMNRNANRFRSVGEGEAVSTTTAHSPSATTLLIPTRWCRSLERGSWSARSKLVTTSALVNASPLENRTFLRSSNLTLFPSRTFHDSANDGSILISGENRTSAS